MNHKVAIIGSAGAPARYGGFETLTHHLVLNSPIESEMSVYCTKHFYPKSDQVKYWNGARMYYLPLKANGIQSVFYDIWSIIHAMTYAHTLIILGVPGCMILPFVKLFGSQKIIVNIDGMEWRREKWSGLAKKFLKFSEWIAVKSAHKVITDNKVLQDYVREYYNKESELVEYGSDHVMKVKPSAVDHLEYDFLRTDYAFKVCRIEPENNIHTVLQAFVRLPEKNIAIVGNWENSEYGKTLKKEYASYDNIYLLDPIYDQKRLDALRGNCSLYVHGHSAGGTNPSLVEAMYLGLPILAYDVNFNRATTEDKAVYFSGASDIIDALKTKDQDEWNAVGTRMEELAQVRYTWKKIVGKYTQITADLHLSSQALPDIQTQK